MNFDKLDAVTKKMNRITEELTRNVEVSEDVLVTTGELHDYLKQKENRDEIVHSLIPRNSAVAEESRSLAPVTEIAADVVNVQAMIDDFQYMRDMLRETTENSRKVLGSITEELMLSDVESQAALVMAYGELNKAQIESVKLFIQSYKEISTILVNLSKVHNSGTPHTVHTTNVLNIEDKSNISSADIINRLRAK